VCPAPGKPEPGEVSPCDGADGNGPCVVGEPFSPSPLPDCVPGVGGPGAGLPVGHWVGVCDGVPFIGGGPPPDSGKPVTAGVTPRLATKASTVPLPAGVPSTVTVSPGVIEEKVTLLVLVTAGEPDVVTDRAPLPLERVTVPPELDWTTPAAYELSSFEPAPCVAPPLQPRRGPFHPLHPPLALFDPPEPLHPVPESVPGKMDSAVAARLPSDPGVPFATTKEPGVASDTEAEVVSVSCVSEDVTTVTEFPLLSFTVKFGELTVPTVPETGPVGTGAVRVEEVEAVVVAPGWPGVPCPLQGWPPCPAPPGAGPACSTAGWTPTFTMKAWMVAWPPHRPATDTLVPVLTAEKVAFDVVVTRVDEDVVAVWVPSLVETVTVPDELEVTSPKANGPRCVGVEVVDVVDGGVGGAGTIEMVPAARDPSAPRVPVTSI